MLHTPAIGHVFRVSHVPVGILPGRKLGRIQLAIPVAVEVAEGRSTGGAFHRPALFRPFRHALCAGGIELLCADEAVAIPVEILE